MSDKIEKELEEALKTVKERTLEGMENLSLEEKFDILEENLEESSFSESKEKIRDFDVITSEEVKEVEEETPENIEGERKWGNKLTLTRKPKITKMALKKDNKIDAVLGEVEKEFQEKIENIEAVNLDINIDASDNFSNKKKFYYRAENVWNHFELEKIIDKMVQFGEMMSGVPLYEYQKEFQRRIFESVLKNDGEIVTALWARQCIAEGSIIHTRDGKLMRIEEHPDAWQTGEQEILEIKARGGRIVRCTANHPILTKAGFIPAGLLKVGDLIVCFANYNDEIYDYGIDGEKLSLAHIQSISPDGVSRTWDMEVPGKGWFICGGIVVHNSGKCFGEGTKIRMADLSVKNVEDIVPGDFVFGEDCSPRRVIDITQGEDQLFRVVPKTSNADSYVVNSAHTLCVKYLNKYLDIQTDELFSSPAWMRRIKESKVKGYKKPLIDTYNRRRDENLPIEKQLEECLHYSKENRIRLLQQIFHGIKPQKYNIEIAFNNRKLARKVQILATSLGLSAGLTEAYCTIPNKDGKPVSYRKHRLTLNGDISFLGGDGGKTKDYLAYGFDLQKIGRGKYYGFTLEGDNKRFFLEDFTVVHNTETVAISINVLMVLLPVLAKVFPEQLSKYKNGIAIGLFAPTSEQGTTTHSRANNRLTSELSAEVLADPDIEASKSYVGGTLKIEGPKKQVGNMIIPEYTSFCKFHSAAKQTKIESKTYNLLILEECQEIDNEKIGKCYEENTVINLKDGTWTTIKDVVERKLEVVTPNGIILPENFMKTGKLPCYEIELVNGKKITVSENHNNFVRIGKRPPEFVTTEELCKFPEETSIAFISGLPYFGEEGTYQEGKQLAYKKGIPNKPFSRDFLLGVLDLIVEEFNFYEKFIYITEDRRILESIQSLFQKFGEQTVISEYAGTFLKVETFNPISVIKNNLRNPKNQDILFIPIKNITFVGDRETYCVELPNTKEMKAINTNFNIMGQDFRSKNIPTNLLSVNYGILSSNSILPMGASTNATTIMIGTCSYQINRFYEMIQYNINKQNASIVKNHFQYDYRVVQKFNPLYKTFIDKEIERTGKTSDSFRLSYALEWILEKGMALTMTDFEEYLADTSARFEYQAEEGFIYSAGYDVAKQMDSSVVTIFKHIPLEGRDDVLKVLVHLAEFEQESYENQFQKVLKLVEKFNLKSIFVDATGKGDPIYERLENALDGTDCIVEGIVFTPKMKHEMATHFYDEMQRKNIRVPYTKKDQERKVFKTFLHQWITCEKNFKGKYMQLEHSSKKGAKDDFVDSFLLALWGSRKELYRKAYQTTNPFMKNRGDFYSNRFGKIMRRNKNSNKAIFR